jgi:16S rRNA (uracil1498-N3)-methyltransferase
LSDGALRILLAESEQQSVLREVLASHAGGEIILAIGPEGGWADDELRIFQQAGWIAASLGPTILRAETAAIAAAAITISEIN